ncbi:MAG: hypothetical protein ACK4RK_13820 [Gemmataceae bacterium]
MISHIPGVCYWTIPCLVLLAGCNQTSRWWRVDNCAAIPSGAIPAPTGTYTRWWENRQAAKAEADDFVIYKHEWCDRSCELGPYGRYHLRQISKRLPTVPFPVLIQADSDEALNVTRQQVIIMTLLEHGIADAEARVIVGFPEAEGLYGEEAPVIYNESFQQSTGFGGQGFGGATNLSGFGGVGGFGGLGGFGGFGY